MLRGYGHVYILPAIAHPIRMLFRQLQKPININFSIATILS